MGYGRFMRWTGWHSSSRIMFYVNAKVMIFFEVCKEFKQNIFGSILLIKSLLDFLAGSQICCNFATA